MPQGTKLAASKTNFIFSKPLLPTVERTMRLFGIVQKAEDVIVLEFFTPLQKIELHSEGKSGDMSAELLHQFHRSFHGTARSQQVITQHYLLTRFNCIQVNLKRVAAIFQVIRN